MAYPSTISTLATPQATDRLNNPSHSQLHQNENTGITEVQTFVGTLSSAVGTLVYDIRSANSNGGGHVQTAATGGTGQTSYSKGDLLVASSSSVLTKLGVGATNQVLVADSSQATGVKWGAVVANKVNITTTATSVSGTSSITNLFTASVIGSTLGTNNAVRFTMPISNLSLFSGRGINFTVSYGSNSILSMISAAAINSLSTLSGKLEGMIVANGATNSQKAYGTLYVGTNNITSSSLGMAAYGTSSVESSATQQIIIQAQMTGANTFGSVVGEALIVEKIV